jgi:hypothetical protein
MAERTGCPATLSLWSYVTSFLYSKTISYRIEAMDSVISFLVGAKIARRFSGDAPITSVSRRTSLIEDVILA